MRSTMRSARVGARVTARVTAVVALAAALLLTVAGCRPLYLPPVPDALPPFPDELRLSDARIVTLAGRRDVAFRLERLPRDGWLAVQWFPPAGAEIASTSVWLEAEDVGRTVRVPFPRDVAREAEGRWRAVLSFGGEILRQLEWSEPAGP